MTALVDWTMLYAGVVMNFVTGIVNGTMKVLYWPTAGVGTSWTSFASADSAFWTGLGVLAGLFLLLRFTGTKFFNSMSSRRANYRDCLEELRGMIDMKNSHPILLRLAWSDAGTYDHTVKAWQQQGGANGSVRFESELDKKGNVGLSKAVALLESIKERYPGVTWADLIQMGGAVAVEISGGPRIDMVYGRVDALEREDSNAYGQAELPCPMWPYPDGAPSAQVHIRNTFYRMGLTNREIVALCGAHTLGRAFEDRTGVCKHSSGDQGATEYTRLTSIARHDGQSGVGMAGGCSWTRQWLKFDNTYFTRMLEKPHDPSLLWLPTDKALYECPEFRPFFELYARDEAEFRKHYSKAHTKMSCLGAKFDPPGGFTLHDKQ